MAPSDSDDPTATAGAAPTTGSTVGSPDGSPGPTTGAPGPAAGPAAGPSDLRADPSVAPDEILPAPGRAGTEGDGGADGGEGGEPREAIEQPAKVMRIGAMVKQLLDEVRQAPLDEAGRTRLREIYEQSVRELASGLSPDLVAELDRMALPFDDGVPSEAELRIAQAQLVGWLEGLFHGIQATLVAQQMAARAQLDEMRQRGLPRGSDGDGRPGTYL